MRELIVILGLLTCVRAFSTFGDAARLAVIGNGRSTTDAMGPSPAVHASPRVSHAAQAGLFGLLGRSKAKFVHRGRTVRLLGDKASTTRIAAVLDALVSSDGAQGRVPDQLLALLGEKNNLKVERHRPSTETLHTAELLDLELAAPVRFVLRGDTPVLSVRDRVSPEALRDGLASALFFDTQRALQVARNAERISSNIEELRTARTARLQSSRRALTAMPITRIRYAGSVLANDTIYSPPRRELLRSASQAADHMGQSTRRWINHDAEYLKRTSGLTDATNLMRAIGDAHARTLTAWLDGATELPQTGKRLPAQLELSVDHLHRAERARYKPKFLATATSTVGGQSMASHWIRTIDDEATGWRHATPQEQRFLKQTGAL